MITVVAWLLGGIALAALAGLAVLTARVAALRTAAATLRAQLDEAAAAQVQLAELRAHLVSLRHDIRGILSPALLVADRLLTHQEPHVRRAGEVMVRTVERASLRLAETRQDQDPPVRQGA